MRLRRAFRSRLRRRVLVTLKSGETFAGVLWEWDGEAVVLRDASLVQPGQQAIPVDGEWVALVAEVSYLQIP